MDTSPLTSPHRRPWAIALVVLVLAFFLPALFSLPGLWCQHDVTTWWSFYRWVDVLGYQRTGEVPLWNSWLYCGVPYAADPQMMTWHPTSFLVRWWPKESLVVVLIVAHWFAGALGVFVLAGDLGLGGLASLVASLGFVFGGPLVTHALAGHVHQMFTVTLAPWTWLLAHRSAQYYPTGKSIARSARAATLCGVVLAVQFLAGSFQVFLYLAMPLLLFMLAGAPLGKIAHEQVRAVLVRVMLPIGLCLLLVAVQFLPTIELLGESVRAKGFWLEGEDPFAMRLHDLLLLLLPYRDHVPQAGLLDGPHQSFWEGFPYLGILPLGLLGIAILRPRLGRSWVILGTAAGTSILYALGTSTPVYRWLQALIPGAELFRAPGRALYVWGLAGALLAGFGVERLAGAIRNPDTAPRERGAAVGWVLLAAAMAAWAVFGWILPAQPASVPGGPPPPSWGLARSGVLAVLAAGWIVVAACRRTRTVPLALAAVAILAADLGVYALPLFRVSPVERVLPPNPVVEALSGAERPVRVFNLSYRNLPQEVALRGGVEIVYGYSPALLTSFVRTLNAAWGVKSPSVQGRWKSEPQILSPDRLVRRHILDLFGARYALSTRPFRQKGFERIATLHIAPRRNLDSTWETGERPLYLCENHNALPRVYVVEPALATEHVEELLERLATTNPRKGVLVEGPLEEADREALGAIQPGFREAHLLLHDPNHVEVEVPEGPAGMLVLLDTWYPGWKAKVEGRPARIYRVNGNFRGVVVPAGARRVRFDFEPASLRWGAWLTFGGMGLAMGLLALTSWRARVRVPAA